MARFKHYDLHQTKMIPVSYADQVLEGSFEHALNEIVEEHLDLSVFEHRYHNDATGRSAYDPRVLLKIVLYGYYRGIVSSVSVQPTMSIGAWQSFGDLMRVRRARGGPRRFGGCARSLDTLRHRLCRL